MYPLTEEKEHLTPGPDYGTPVGAGQEIICAYRLFTDDPDGAMARVEAGEIGMWIQGTAVYDDCFDEPHRIQFRLVFGGRLAGSGGMALHADKEGNYAD